MNAEDILKTNNLKNTACRKHIITTLLDSRVAMTEDNIKSLLPDLFDRVTFYRSLKTLEESNIIHRIVLQDNSTKYALNQKNNTEVHNHAHFHCKDCDDVVCIESEINPPSNLPNGYSIDSAQILLEGTCLSCKENK